MLQPIGRAILSVSNKREVVRLGKVLDEYGVEILSTGGTKRELVEAGVRVRAVEDYTGFPEIMDHRVVTLHPRVHGGLLAVRDKPTHMTEAEDNGIAMIDMAVINLYPFQEVVAKDGVTYAEAVENIDIGGPAMLRAAAKNHRYVAAVCDPSFYDAIIEEMIANSGKLTDETRARLARATFRHTAQYDTAVSDWLDAQAA